MTVVENVSLRYKNAEVVISSQGPPPCEPKFRPATFESLRKVTVEAVQAN